MILPSRIDHSLLPHDSKYSPRRPAGLRGVILAAAVTACMQGAAAAQSQFSQLAGGLPSGLASGSPALGDVDGDGDLDLVVDSRGLFLNDGSGNFLDVTTTHLPAASGGAPTAMGDVDGDGDLDLVAPDRLWRNSGNGIFSDVTASQLPAGPGTCVALGDVDVDGDLDVVVGSVGQDRLLSNDGTGTFTDVTATRFPAFNSWTLSVALADIDVDGDLDLAIGTAYQNRLYRNDGTGTFTDVTSTHLPIDYDTTNDLAFGDVDADGDVDLICGNSYFGLPEQSRLYRNNGTGVFTDVTAISLPTAVAATQAVALADFDEDGDLDLVCAGAQRLLYTNDGTGTFSDVSAARMPAGLDWTYGVAIGDVDADGDSDLVSGNACPPGGGGVGWIPSHHSCQGGQSRLFTNLRRQLDARLSPHIGQPWTLRAYVRYGPPASDLALIFLSTTRLSVSLPPYGVLGIDPMTPLPLLVIPTLTGLAATSWSVPNLPSAIGTTIHAQALFFTPTSLDRLSNVVTVVVQ